MDHPEFATVCLNLVVLHVALVGTMVKERGSLRGLGHFILTVMEHRQTLGFAVNQCKGFTRLDCFVSSGRCGLRYIPSLT